MQDEEKTSGPWPALRDEIREFYETISYPAPLTTLDEHGELYAGPERRRALFHLLWPGRRPDHCRRILIAGCGTSQAARYALREPDAQITAIDISEMSLNHTRRLQEKYGLHNLELQLLAIDDVHQLGQTFDQIICTGVLHHLADPDRGLQSLRNALKPDGAMQIMVYAKYGRTGIDMMQSYCRLLGITASRHDLQELSAMLRDLPVDHPLTPLLEKTTDFQHPDGLADTFLNPRDRTYSVREVYEWLDRCGMQFGRWWEQAPYSPQCGVVAKSPHAIRLMSLPIPTQYAAVELFRGTMTRHNFVAFRSDRVAESQPINFEGEEWRNYIPIRIPWTECVRNQGPGGSVAVLRNRSHQHPDLVLPVNAAQYHLLNQVDGSRTLDNIMQNHGKQSDRTLRYFEQLWHYDQIVFDASRAVPHKTTTSPATQHDYSHQ